MAARDDYLRAPCSVFHCHNVRAEAVTDVVIFHCDSLALRHDSLKFPKVENDIRAIEPAHGATNNFPRAILKLLVNHFLFSLTDSLHHGLLCSLRRNAPEIFWRDFDFYNL